MDTLQFCAANDHNHLFQLGSALRLTLHVTMLRRFCVWPIRKQIGGFAAWNIAHRAASVLDIEVAGNVRWMWRYGHLNTKRA